MSRLKTAVAATATSAGGTTPTDVDESEGVKTGEADNSSLLVAASSPADAHPVDALPACAAVVCVTHGAATTARADGAKPTATF